jgi:DNA-binding transcriptional ArsR family regulator
LEIEKGAPARIFEGEEHSEWQTLDVGEAFRIAEALADPLRQWIYQELGKGSLRQAELAKRASDFFKRKITNVLMRYHLQHLENAGLVKFERDSRTPRAKIVHRASEFRVQFRPFFPLGRKPGEELADELLKVFKARSRGR